MSCFTFKLRGTPPQRVDLSQLTPATLNGMTENEIADLEIGTTRASLKVGDLFYLKLGEIDEIVFEGGAERLDRVGAGLGSGVVRVAGDVGVEVGRGMTGGVIFIEGDVGAFAGSGMKGGALKIGGAAGERLGGPLAGETEGMNGGLIHVGGNTGDRAADKMRRGLILVEGAAGDYVGSRMLAGTLAIGGRAGALPGYLMNRGSILLAGGVGEMSPTFVDCGVFALVAAKVIAAHVEATSAPLAGAFRAPLRRFAGDMAALGKGEIFVGAG